MDRPHPHRHVASMSRLASPRAYSQLCRAPNRDPCKKNHAVFLTKNIHLPLLFSRSPDAVNNPTPYFTEPIPPPRLFLPPPRAISSDTPLTHQWGVGRFRLPPSLRRYIWHTAAPSAFARISRVRAHQLIRPMRCAHSSVVSQPGGASWPSACASAKSCAQSVRLELDGRDKGAIDAADLIERVCAIIV